MLWLDFSIFKLYKKAIKVCTFDSDEMKLNLRIYEHEIIIRLDNEFDFNRIQEFFETKLETNKSNFKI